MPESPEKFYVTTPIYYVNARPHIGHAYTTIAADVLARRHHLLGHDTFFLTGTDEHGQKIERSARAAGLDPQAFADQVSASFRELWIRMGILDDELSQKDPLLRRRFIRTTDPAHIRGVQHLFRTLQARGAIDKNIYTGQYCVSDEAYVDGPPGIRCPDCGRVTETVSEENYYFKLSRYQIDLLNLIESNTLLITPETRKNEVLSFLRGNVAAAQAQTSGPPDASSTPDAVILSTAKDPRSSPEAAQTQGAPSMTQGDMGGNVSSPPAPNSTDHIAHSAAGHPYVPGALKDLSISRTSFTWGVPVPGDEKHVIYVWLDALANYMTALGYGSDTSTNQDTPADHALFQKFWPADLHLVGKEIIRFHCVYWPAFLLAAGLPLPKAVTAHGWLLFEESKMSKSRGNIVRTETILDAFGDHYRKELVRLGQPEPTKPDADLFASDVLRYFLLREIPFGQDGSFSFDAMITRYNADLANGYGNLVSRTVKLTAQSGHSPSCPSWFDVNLSLQEAEGRVAITHIHNTHSDEHERLNQSPELNLAVLAVASIYFYEQEIAKLNFSSSMSFSAIRAELVKTQGADKASAESSGALDWVLVLIAATDEYLSSTKPWVLIKSGSEQEKQRAQEILYTSLETIRIITALIYPFTPFAASQVWRQLGLGDIEEAMRDGVLRNLAWGGGPDGSISARRLGPLSPIFPRIETKRIPEFIQIMTDMEANTPRHDTSADQNPDDLTAITADNDVESSQQTEFSEAPLSSVSAQTPGAPSLAQSHRGMGRGATDLEAGPSESTRNSTGAGTPAPSRLSNETTSSGPADPADPTHPGAPPRTSGLPSTNPGAQVGGSSAPVPVLSKTPSHTEAQGSGLFAGSSSAAPIPNSSQEIPAFAPQITIDDFAKLDLRVAKIVVAERIPKADKLLRLEVDLGSETRQILSGIAPWYTPEELVGRRIVVIANLAPRTMRGLSSHGMLLAASVGDNGRPILATFPEADDLPPGARLK